METKDLVAEVAHQRTPEEERGKGIIPHNHKGVTWNTKDDIQEKGTTDTLIINVAPEQHASEDEKAGHHPTTG